MWSTITNLKDNIKSIAADVLETQEEIEADVYETNGPTSPVHDFPRRTLSLSTAAVGKESELQWYKEELTRMQAAESDIQTLSTNYVNALKEKEEETRALRQQNEELKKQLVSRSEKSSESATELTELREKVKALQDEIHRTIDGHQDQVAALQDSHRKRTDVLFARHKREVESLQADLKANGVQPGGGDSVSTNGHTMDSEAHQKRIKELELKVKQLLDKDRDYARQVIEKDQAFGKLKDAYERSSAEVRQLKEAVEKERGALSATNQELEREHEAMEAALRECNMLKAERQRMVAEMAEARKRAEEQEGLAQEAKGDLQQSLLDYNSRTAQLRAEREALQQALKASQEAQQRANGERPEGATWMPSGQELLDLKAQAEAREQQLTAVTTRLRAVEKALDEREADVAAARAEKDKAAKDLARLKQHLLDMESADAEKMERDMEKMASLEDRVRRSESRVGVLEQSLAQAQAEAAEANRRANEGAQCTAEELESLRTEVVACRAALESKDVELNNLQIALGQYYAESEAQERLHMELSSAREAIAKLAEDLRNANARIDIKEEEKQKAMATAGVYELQLSDGHHKLQKLQDEVAMLRRALEQSMVRINRMSTDSDFYVDRRIVIKLLVTYFQRSHSREVLDLMARMLGFSEEEKQRVGLAQQQGGVVRGMLGFSGRLVGGLLRGAAAQEADSTPLPDGTTSFSDLWIDFLLKESEERERREAADRAQALAQAHPPASPKTPRSSGAGTTQSSSPRFYTNLPPTPPPLNTYSLTPSSRAPADGANAGLMGMPNVFLASGEETGSRESPVNGFLVSSSSLAASPISAADAAYMNSGEFSAVPLNSITPSASSSSSPYAGQVGKSRTMPRSL